MTVEKKTIRSDIPRHNTLLNGHIAYAGSIREDQSRMIVGRDIVLNGDIAACDHLIVEGQVDAKALSTHRLDILESGTLNGCAEVQDAVIAGRFEGRLTVYGRLTLKTTAQISGDVHYGTLEVEGGARISACIAALPPVVIEERATPAIPKVAKPAAEQTVDNVAPLFEASAEDKSESEGTGVFRRAVGQA